MRFLSRFILLLGFAAALPLARVIGAENTDALPFLSPVFGDHMVLQRGKPNTFWGWTTPGSTVRVTIGEQNAVGTAGADGRWQTALDAPPIGGPYTVQIDGNEHLALQDVLVGDVWLCSGQSNMAFPLRASLDGDEEAKQANYPQLRVYAVATRPAYAPVATAKGEWQVCSPETAGRISAVAYYFARKLQRELGIPIGLVQSAVGGSPAESWISREGIGPTGEFEIQTKEIARLHAAGANEYGSFLMHWLDEHDVGSRDEAWAKPDFDDSAWRTVDLPGGFADLGVPTEPAIVWFRREITLPDPLPDGPVRIQLGVVERMDTTYVNGRWVGASSWVENPRNYVIPAAALHPGKNEIAVRVFKTKPDGGFMSPAKTLRVQLGDGSEIPLAGSWRAAVSFDARPPAPMPLDFENYPTMPTVLYNGMIAPVVPLAITGAIWYQGEANSSRAQQYRKLMPALIADWRARFGQGDFPFYIAGLPAFQPRKSAPPSHDGWAELRDAQAFTVRNVRNAGLAVTIDTGEADNIHPRLKEPVGERLALRALAGHYGKSVVDSGPTLRRVERRGRELVLHFAHADGGLQVRGEKLGEFAIAGADRAWHWADARIEGADTVVVSSPEVPAPVFASYAWQSNPLATLFNGAGLPAQPFRSDE